MLSTDSLPEQLGNYRIIEKTGQGRSGAIFLAEKIDTRQRVTLKILDPQFLLIPSNRFLQTMEALVSLEHPRVLPILEAGQESSFYYLVSPLIGGGTTPPLSLETRLRQGPLDIPTALEITCDLLQTLADAHQKNHLHLGLNPDAILFDSNGAPFLSDFGLSSWYDRSGEYSEDSSSESKQVSSYRAPEQQRGEATDQRTDLFSLSVILYEMLTGYRPDLQYVPPSEVLPGLGTYLDSFLEQGLQRDPGKRFQLASDMLTAIDRSLQEASTSSIIPPPVDRSSSSISETRECPFCSRQSPAKGDRCPLCDLSWKRQCPGCDGLNDFPAQICIHCDQSLPKETPLILSIQRAEKSYQCLADETMETQERIDSGIAAIDSYTSARSLGAFSRDIEERLNSIEIHLAHLFQIRGEQFLSSGNIQEGILDLEESLRLAPSPAVDRILQAVWARIQKERKRASHSGPSKAPEGSDDPIEKTTQTLFREPWPQSRSSIVPSPSVAIPAPSRSRRVLFTLCLFTALGGGTLFYIEQKTPSSQTLEKPPPPTLAPFQQALELHRTLVSRRGTEETRALTPQITDLVLQSIRSHRKKGNLDAVRTESQWLLSQDARAGTEKLSLELAATGVLRALEFEKRGDTGAAARSLRCALQMDPKLRLDARCRPFIDRLEEDAHLRGRSNEYQDAAHILSELAQIPQEPEASSYRAWAGLYRAFQLHSELRSHYHPSRLDPVGWGLPVRNGWYLKAQTGEQKNRYSLGPSTGSASENRFRLILDTPARSESASMSLARIREAYLRNRSGWKLVEENPIEYRNGRGLTLTLESSSSSETVKNRQVCTILPCPNRYLVIVSTFASDQEPSSRDAYLQILEHLASF